MKVLMVLTSHDQLGDTGRKTGFWLEELAAPYYTFKDAGVDVTLASPKGGRPPLDPKSNEPDFQTDLTRRFEKDKSAEAQLDATLRLDSVRQEDFDTVFYPGGHGPMWDLAEDRNSIRLIESFIAAGKPIGIVCHSTGALRHVKAPDGKVLVQGKEVTGFTDGEEEEVGLTRVVPFLVEDEMLKLGAVFSKTANWTPHVVSDGLLITGQNPHSSGPAAETLMAAVQKRAAPAVAARASSDPTSASTGKGCENRRSISASELKGCSMDRAHHLDQGVFRSVLPEDIEWRPFAAFPPSVGLAVVVGRPTEPGPYVIRVRAASGAKLMPHRHPEDRIYTVISGVFYVGLGEEFDENKLQAFPPGSVIVLPGGTPHFHWAKSGEYVTQVTAIGPLGLEYLHMEDDPRHRPRE